MKANKIAIIVIALLTALFLLPAVAQAYTWSHVGGDPLVPGGVWNEGQFSYLFLNSSKVAKANRLVANADKLPSWVMKSAHDEVAAGNIYSSTIKRGTKVGAMSFGRKKVRVVKYTTYKGQYKKLPYWYVVAGQCYTSGYYKITETYRVCMAKPCGNAFVFMHTIKREKLPPPPVPPAKHKLFVKKIDCDTGAMLAGWQINGTVDTQTVGVVTSADSPTLVGEFEAGTTYNLSEVQQQGWEVVTPSGGTFHGTMPDCDLTLTFVNKKICPPPASHQLVITGCFTPVICLDTTHFRGTLHVEIFTHSDNDAVMYTWNVNGDVFSTTANDTDYPFLYNTNYTATVTATDAAGHTAVATLPTIYEPGPGSPPPVQ